MRFSATELTAFFTAEDQMGMPQETRVWLRDEGITDPSDLDEFDKESIKEISETLRKPGDRIRDPARNAPPGSTIPRPPYTFGTKIQKWLLTTCNMVKSCKMIGNELTAANMHYDTIRRDFQKQWEALERRKKAEARFMDRGRKQFLHFYSTAFFGSVFKAIC